MNPHVFREYDIRGIADRDLTDPFVRALGQAIGHARVSLPTPGRRCTVAVGRDCRLSSPRLYAALVDGITAVGVDVIDVGVVPSPMLYFAAHVLPVDGAVQITGSHNPAEDNGFKMLAGRSAIYGEAIQDLRRLALADAFPAAAGRGTVRHEDLLARYVDHAAGTLRLGPRRPRCVVDAGNGAGGPAALALYARLGLEVVPLHCEMDGRFPNHHPDPTVEENLADLVEAVRRTGAEVGLAFDGDADRLGVVDARGRVVWGDQLMILFSRALLAEHPGATFVAEVKCSQALFDEIERAGGRAIMWKVGHSLIKAKMKEEGAALAGEMSGHLFFAERYLGFDDAIYAGARLVELLSQGDVPFEAMVDSLPRLCNTPELRVDVPDEQKVTIVARVAERLAARFPVITIDGVRVQFPDGWGLVRASNTQAALVLRFEATDPIRLAALRRLVEDEIATVRKDLT